MLCTGPRSLPVVSSLVVTSKDDGSGDAEHHHRSGR